MILVILKTGRNSFQPSSFAPPASTYLSAKSVFLCDAWFIAWVTLPAPFKENFEIYFFSLCSKWECISHELLCLLARLVKEKVLWVLLELSVAFNSKTLGFP